MAKGGDEPRSSSTDALDKRDVVYPQGGMSFGRDTEGNCDRVSRMDESWAHRAEWDKGRQERAGSLISLLCLSCRVRFIETESGRVVARGRGREGGSLPLLQFGKRRKFWWWMRGVAAPSCECLQRPSLYTWLRWKRCFALCIFHHHFDKAMQKSMVNEISNKDKICTMTNHLREEPPRLAQGTAG